MRRLDLVSMALCVVLMALVVAVALTYLLGFERDLRGAATGDRVFALVGAGARVTLDASGAVAAASVVFIGVDGTAVLEALRPEQPGAPE